MHFLRTRSTDPSPACGVETGHIGKGRTWLLRNQSMAVPYRDKPDCIGEARLMRGYGGPDLTTGRLVRLMPGYRIEQVTVYMVYPSRHFLSGKVRSFVDFISAAFSAPESDPWLEEHQVGAKFPPLKVVSTGPA